MTQEQRFAAERRLAAGVDDVVEHAIRYHWTPAEIFAALWAPILSALDGSRAAAELVDETGAVQRFDSEPDAAAAAVPWPDGALQLFATQEAVFRALDGRSFAAYPFEVAGERLGAVLVELRGAPDAEAGATRAALLAAAAGGLDNHLAELVAGRRKQRAADQLSLAR